MTRLITAALACLSVASWCAPCRAEMPNILEAYKNFGGKDFEVIGISLDSQTEMAL